MSIITGRGDNGETDLLFGKRMTKSSLRAEALGDIDELNAALGMARASDARPEWITMIDTIQEKLVGLMGQIATLPEDDDRYNAAGFPRITDEDVDWLTSEARRLEASGIHFTGWARPGAEGCHARATMDFARTVARRAERSLLCLHENDGQVPEAVRLFFNRLSDALWILARVK
ncbi:MAG: cob(I)yrinic acid a,c-diamide adenosyltransferase [Luteolibacter sp.]|jgi:cob(I)alamin adenosyltransferase